MALPYITSFLIRHSAEIKASFLLSDQMEIELHNTVPLRDAMILFADLITYCQPRKAHIHSTTPYRIRLEFGDGHSR